MPKKLPIIGYNVEIELENENWVPVNLGRAMLYHEAIVLAGGEPLFFTFNDSLEEIANKVDGYIFTGGKDLPSSLYNEIPHEKLLTHEHSDQRYQFEKSIFEKIRGRVPILGICLGAQFLNVLSGGTLTQHIENHKEHRGGKIREITVLSDSRVSKILDNQKLQVTCYHHQSVNIIGNGLKITGYDENNIPHIIESMDENEWIVGLQFHPERYIENKSNSLIFDGFVQEANKVMGRSS